MRAYGDLVNAVCYSSFVPCYAYAWYQEPSTGGLHVIEAFAVTSLLSWLSVLTSSKGSAWVTYNATLSVLACIGNSVTIAAMNLYRWPHPDEIVVVPQFFWSLMIITGNVSVPYPAKALNGIISFCSAVTVVAFSSPLLEIRSSLPLLLGSTAVFLLFNFYTSIDDEEGGKCKSKNKSKSKGSIFSAHGASLILAGTFAYHMSSELIDMVSSPGYAKEGGYSILKAAFFALVGLAAAGSFRREIDLKETLEVLVEQRAAQLRVVEHALQASETAITIVDSAQRIVWCNAAMDRLTRSESGALKDGHILQALKLPFNGGQGLTLKAVDGTHSPASPPSTWFSQTGPTKNEIVVHGLNVEIEVSPFPSNQEDLSSDSSQFLVVLKDITAQKARDRAEKAAVREAMAAQAMQESMQTLSHELRTPLQGIMGMTSLLVDDNELPPQVTENMMVVMTSARLLLTLINNMLDVRKCDSSMMDEFQLAPLNLSKALTQAVEFTRPFAGISGVSLEIDDIESFEETHVLSNSLRFQQVMINLISNAIKYSAKDSDVTISVKIMTKHEADVLAGMALASGHQLDDHGNTACNLHGSSAVAVVDISDGGTGIPPEQRDLIFGKFSRLSIEPSNAIGGHASGQPSGTGLGLNLCLKFLQRMNGNIWVRNSNVPGRGSIFSFFLPTIIVDRPRSQQNSSLAPIRPESPRAVVDPHSIEHLHVLAVDDTLINLKVLDRMLRRTGVGKIKCASSGEEALRELEKARYNLVLTDLQMPHMDGLELTTKIRSKYGDKAPVIVGLTADNSLDAKCESVGMQSVLHKPITATQLQTFFGSISTKVPMVYL